MPEHLFDESNNHEYVVLDPTCVSTKSFLLRPRKDLSVKFSEFQSEQKIVFLCNLSLSK